MKKNILFVCHGNICRSPMAEYIFKYLSNNSYNVASRATSTEELGNDIYPKAKRELDAHSIPYQKHYAKQITIDDYSKYDLIICFDEYNLNNLKRILPEINKVIKLSDSDIDDPWYTGNFTKAYNEIYNGCIKLLDRLNKEI